MHNLDWTGIATVIGAVGAFIVTLGTLGMQIVAFIDNRRAKRDAIRREAKMDELTRHVEDVKAGRT